MHGSRFTTRNSLVIAIVIALLASTLTLVATKGIRRLRNEVRSEVHNVAKSLHQSGAAPESAALPSDSLLLGPTTAVPAKLVHEFTVFSSGALAQGWQDWSWTPRDLSAKGPDGTGTAARVDFKPWGGLSFHASSPLQVWDGTVQVYLNGGSTGGQHVQLMLTDGAGKSGKAVSLAPMLPNGVVPAQHWVTVTVPIHESISSNAGISAVTLQENAGNSTRTMYVGSVVMHYSKLEDLPAQSTDITAQVDTTADRHPISPYIYGLAGDSGDAYMRQLEPALVRWGGNATTRYNWQIGHAWNAAHDWYYMNVNYGNVTGSASDAAISRAAQFGAAEWLTIPTIGWVAKDTTSASFPGPDGKPTDGQGSSCTDPKVTADPHRTSIAVGPSFMQAWLEHLQANHETVQFASMDNEPDLWGVTHYDVHPSCTGYDEILHEFTTYASAVKAVDPHLQVTGPASCCWYYYGNSMLGAPDRAKHGGLGFLPWFLQSVKQYDAAHGGRTLDVLDVHYYPDGTYNNVTDAATSAWRLLETRSLWDPAYIDHSWIAQPIELIPRLKTMIEQQYPGTRIGIGEWNFGAETSMNGALAIADVLGIFGQQGLYMAAYWQNPPADSPGAAAFQMYRNYDGHGAGFGETSVQTRSSNRDRVSVFAALRQKDGHLTVVLVNKMPAASAHVTLAVKGFKPGQVTSYVLRSGQPSSIVPNGTLPAGDNISVALEPYSVTLLDLVPAA